MAPIKINVEEDNGIKYITSNRCSWACSGNFASMPRECYYYVIFLLNIYCRNADRGQSKKVEKSTLTTLILSESKDPAYL